jgi:aminodeoxyfutalosine synthase
VTTLDRIREKAAIGERLTDADAQALLLSKDIIAVGVAADTARERVHGDRVTYVRVADVPLDGTGEPTWPAAAREIRLAGDTIENLDAALMRARALVAAAGDTPVSAFSLEVLEAAASTSGASLSALLARVRETGLDVIAEAPFDRLEDPVAAFRAVRDAGLTVARVTVHRTPAGGALALYRRVREVQDTFGSLRAFAPLARRLSAAHPTTGYEDLKQVAIARLLLDAVDMIQVDWALYGPKLAQVALTFGADDLDAVPASDEAPQGLRRAPLEEVRRNIVAASRVPVERDGRFRLVSEVPEAPRPGGA